MHSDYKLLDILSNTIRGLQKYMKLHRAPVRVYDGGPRHVREATRQYDGKTIKELVILNVGLKSCGWNNCRMCGLSTKAEQLTEEELCSEIDKIAEYPLLKDRSFKSLYMSPYSFFSDREMSVRSREMIYEEIINANTQIENIVFMTRPEYLKEEKISHMRNHLKTQKIIIWMGLETSDPFVNRYCIDKGYALKDVEGVSEYLKKYDVDTGIWVLLKPPFISEGESIQYAITTIREGLDRGYEIRVMPCEVMDYTITKVLFDLHMYSPPYLWSVIEVLNGFTPEEHLKINVSGPHFERDWRVVPREIYSSHIHRYPSNCPRCNDTVMKAIDTYNRKKDIGVFSGLDCSCREEWRLEMTKKSPPLKMRLKDDFLKVINHIAADEDVVATTPNKVLAES